MIKVQLLIGFISAITDYATADYGHDEIKQPTSFYSHIISNNEKYKGTHTLRWEEYSVFRVFSAEALESDCSTVIKRKLDRAEIPTILDPLVVLLRTISCIKHEPEAAISEPSEAAVVEPSEAVIAEPSEAAVVEPSEAAISEPSEAAVVEPSDTHIEPELFHDMLLFAEVFGLEDAPIKRLVSRILRLIDLDLEFIGRLISSRILETNPFKRSRAARVLLCEFLFSEKIDFRIHDDAIYIGEDNPMGFSCEYNAWLFKKPRPDDPEYMGSVDFTNFHLICYENDHIAGLSKYKQLVLLCLLGMFPDAKYILSANSINWLNDYKFIFDNSDGGPYRSRLGILNEDNLLGITAVTEHCEFLHDRSFRDRLQESIQYLEVSVTNRNFDRMLKTLKGANLKQISLHMAPNTLPRLKELLNVVKAAEIRDFYVLGKPLPIEDLAPLSRRAVQGLTFINTPIGAFKKFREKLKPVMENIRFLRYIGHKYSIYTALIISRLPIEELVLDFEVFAGYRDPKSLNFKISQFIEIVLMNTRLKNLILVIPSPENELLQEVVDIVANEVAKSKTSQLEFVAVGNPSSSKCMVKPFPRPNNGAIRPLQSI